MSTYKTVGVCTYIWSFVFLLTLKTACYNCQQKLANGLFESIYAKDNLAFSPSNIYVNLYFVSSVAEGQTSQEILLNAVKERAYELPSNAVVAVSLFVNSDKSLTPCLRKGYENILEYVDFDSPSGAKKINSWISTHTKRYLKNIQSQRMLSAKTLINLVSTIYINPQWKRPFTSYVKTSGNKIMMHQYKKFFYGNLSDLNAVAVVIPFYSSYFRLLVLMPNDNDLRRLSKNLLKVDLNKIQKRLTRTKLNLYFPDINEIHMNRSLTKPLKNMFGIKEAFTENANFSKLKPCGDNSYIKEFKHYGAMSTDLEGAHFTALTEVQWDKYDKKTVKFADDDPLENTYSDSSDSAVQMDGEPEISAATEQQNNATHVLFDRSFFYAAIYDHSIVFAGTYS